MLKAHDAGSNSGCGAVPDANPSRAVQANRAEPFHVVQARQLRHLRHRYGFSRKVLAACLGWPVARVRGHERGTTRVLPRELIGYAQFYGVRLSAFFRDPPTGDPPRPGGAPHG